MCVNIINPYAKRLISQIEKMARGYFLQSMTSGGIWRRLECCWGSASVKIKDDCVQTGILCRSGGPEFCNVDRHTNTVQQCSVSLSLLHLIQKTITFHSTHINFIALVIFTLEFYWCELIKHDWLRAACQAVVELYWEKNRTERYSMRNWIWVLTFMSEFGIQQNNQGGWPPFIQALLSINCNYYYYHQQMIQFQIYNCKCNKIYTIKVQTCNE